MSPKRHNLTYQTKSETRRTNYQTGAIVANDESGPIESRKSDGGLANKIPGREVGKGEKLLCLLRVLGVSVVQYRVRDFQPTGAAVAG